MNGIEARSEQTFRDTNAMLQAATTALTQADRTLRQANAGVGPAGRPGELEVVNALRETAAAARSMRDLADELAAQPQLAAVRQACSGRKQPMVLCRRLVR